MGAPQKFKISSALKDIIGRDLITNDFVAIFELVKNSFDAHAKGVQVEFDKDSITIVDDGKGMSRNDIISKWLFVAYSAKKTGEEDQDLPRDYRDQISERRGYAGNKGIGRFSCDRLGTTLDLYTRPVGGRRVEHLNIDWTRFERNPKREFATIGTSLSFVKNFPSPRRVKPPRKNGTMLVISGLRSGWDYRKIESLRSYLAKLVDPFQTSKGASISTHVVDEEWPELEGTVGNEIIDLLDQRTAKIEVSISGETIHSTLHDRGVLIYEIEEPNPYSALADCEVNTSIYFLNRSAKHTFTSRMGLQPIQFGHLFLFVNGFRVFPVGEPTDDTFGIGRRKQQGTARYLGLRDILGKIDIRAAPGKFVEASSRDAGLIDSAATHDLHQALMRHIFSRFERYVVNVNWVDALDQAREDASGLKSDTARARIIKIVQAMAGTKNVKLLNFDRELINVINERSADFEEAMSGLAIVAQETGDASLLARVERSRQRFIELRQAAEEAKEAAEREAQARQEAEKRARAAELHAEATASRLESVEKQAQMLLHAQEREDEELTLLHHQVIIYASEVQALTRRSLRRLSSEAPSPQSLRDDLEQINFHNSKILAVTRIATQANFKLKADRIDADIIQYMAEYTEKVATLYGDIRRATFDRNGITYSTEFNPIEISIVIDNLFSNAGKAEASEINFAARKSSTGKAIEIVVSDNGHGISTSVDPTKIFERSYSGSRRGSGLGLYHVTQVLEDIGGAISLDPDRDGQAAQFVIRLPRKGKSA